PIGILEFVIVTVSVFVPFALLIHPFWHLAETILRNGNTVHSLPEAIGLGLLGVPLLLVMPYVLVGMGALHTGLAWRLLGPSRDAELEERVDVLTVSRSLAGGAALVGRRPVERDPGGGAPQRRVGVGSGLRRGQVEPVG